MSALETVYRVRDWDDKFETRGTRRHQCPFHRITISTSLDSLVLRRLLSAPDGATAYGVWILLLQIAAKAPQRGVLADQTGAYTAADLALLTGIPESQVQSALELLCQPRIGLLELVSHEAVSPQLDEIPLAEKSLARENSMPAVSDRDPIAATGLLEKPPLFPLPQPHTGPRSTDRVPVNAINMHDLQALSG